MENKTRIGKYLDETVLDKYCPEANYWAGFIAADGCIDTNNTIRIELGGKDKEHVTKFKEFFKAEHLISHNELKDSYKVGFSSKLLKEILYYNYAVTIDKTHNLVFPLLPTEEDYRHYLRGFFDGDGCFTEYFAGRPTAAMAVFLTSGSLNFLHETLQYLKSSNVVLGGSIHKKALNCWHIQFSVNDTKKFLTWIYTGATVYLDRKYEKYVHIIVNNNRATR